MRRFGCCAARSSPADARSIGRLVETIWAMDAEANGGVGALRRNRLADWVARARAVHRVRAAEPSGNPPPGFWTITT